MEVYEYETREAIQRFLAHRISLAECVASLDAALAGLVPKLTCEQLPRLQALLRTNNETVMEEMEVRSLRPTAHPQMAD
jgi:hypothetical protein